MKQKLIADNATKSSSLSSLDPYAVISPYDSSASSSYRIFSEVFYENISSKKSISYIKQQMNDYFQDVNIERVIIYKGCNHKSKEESQNYFDENSKVNCKNPESRGKTRVSKSNESKSRNKDKANLNSKSKNALNTGVGPGIAIQFDLNKLFREISKCTPEKCAMCGKPQTTTKGKKNEVNDHIGTTRSPTNSDFVRPLKDLSVPFIFNDRIKIIIKNDGHAKKSKLQSKSNKMVQSQTESMKKKRGKKLSTSDKDPSKTNPIELKNESNCPEFCPMVEQQRPISRNYSEISFSKKKRDSSTLENESKRKFETECQKYRHILHKTGDPGSCDRSCSQKKCGDKNKSEVLSTMNSENIKVTLKNVFGELEIDPRIVKDGNDVKIIIKLKKKDNRKHQNKKQNKAFSTESIILNYKKEKASEKIRDQRNELNGEFKHTTKKLCSNSVEKANDIEKCTEVSCPWWKNYQDLSEELQRVASNDFSSRRSMVSPNKLSNQNYLKRIRIEDGPSAPDWTELETLLEIEN